MPHAALGRYPKRFGRRRVIRVIILAVAVLLGWLVLGRQITLVVDRLITLEVASLPVRQVAFLDGTIEIAGKPLSTMTSEGAPADLTVFVDSAKHVVLAAGADTLTVGSGTIEPVPVGALGYVATPDQGDEVHFTQRRSAISWPTPFEFNFMTGQSPSSKRHVYYRLVWKKRTGGRLEAVWRYEQWRYPSYGWGQSGEMTRQGSTGLIRLSINPDPTAR